MIIFICASVLGFWDHGILVHSNVTSENYIRDEAEKSDLMQAKERMIK